MVFARGQVPCDILFVGEAPGDSEDALGKPFVGSAGKLLDSIIRRAFAMKTKLRLAFTNLVACYPRAAKELGHNEPPNEAVLACSPRLVEFVKIANPRLIVCVGALARDRLDSKIRKPVTWVQGPVPSIDIKHPAAILRSNEAMQGLEVQRCVVQLINAIETYFTVKQTQLGATTCP